MTKPALLLIPLFVTCVSSHAAPPDGAQSLLRVQVSPTEVAVVNMSELARQHPDQAPESVARSNVPFRTINEETGATVSSQNQGRIHIPGLEPAGVVSTLVASPSPTLSFEALPDSQAVGSSSSFIPPDTQGAVGLTKLMVTLNNNVRIQDKATGTPLSTVSLTTFWAPTGATGPFDPKIAYDPYNNRWIFVAFSNASSANSSICIGVSQTSDPSGAWNLSRTIVGDSLWADFPCLGFNKNWIAVSANMFRISNDTFSSGTLLVFDYPMARAGTFNAMRFFNISSANGGFCLHPARTYSPTEDTLFLASHFSSGGASYILSTLTGTPALPALVIGPLKVNGLGAWSAVGGELLPQAPEPGGSGTRKIDVGDSFIRARVVYRSGNIYYSQTVGLPSGGAPTRTAAQWVRISTNGTFLEGGRIEDPTATATNGGKWYAYSSIDVNAFNDIVLGFSQYSSSQFPSGAYAFKARGDVSGTMRDPFVYKAGVDYYEKDFGSGENRWGDYSNTQVDPSDDGNFWTIQEYSKARVGTGNGSGRWGTWWAKVTPVDPLPVQIASMSGAVIEGNIVRLEWTTLSEVNNYGFEVQKSFNTPDAYLKVSNGFVAGHGTTTVPHTYTFVDNEPVAGTSYWRLNQIDLDGTSHFTEGVRVDLLTDARAPEAPVAFVLNQNYPNPFNPSTTIRYGLPNTSTVRLIVTNTLGQRVATLVQGVEEPGYHETRFDASGLASGAYFYRLEARPAVGDGRSGTYVDTRKLLLVR